MFLKFRKRKGEFCAIQREFVIDNQDEIVHPNRAYSKNLLLLKNNQFLGKEAEERQEKGIWRVPNLQKKEGQPLKR